MPWEIWANTEGNEHFPNTAKGKKKNLGMLVRFDHAAKHRNLRPPPPGINTRSSHLSCGFLIFLGWIFSGLAHFLQHVQEVRYPWPMTPGSGHKLSWLEFIRKTRSWASGLMEKLDGSCWSISSLWAGVSHLGPVQVPVWMPQFSCSHFCLATLPRKAQSSENV